MPPLNLQLDAQHCQLLAQRGLSAAIGTTLRGSFYFEPPVRVWQRVTLTECRIGAFSYIAPNVSLHKTEIGRYCSIGDGVSVLANHPANWLTTSPIAYEPLFPEPFRQEQYPEAANFDKLLPVKIGNDVWIGSNVKLKSGISIGDGAIIGAGAVVTKNVAAFTVVGGVPAKTIRNRFDEAVIGQIQTLKWFQYDLTKIPLPFGTPEQALAEIAYLAGNGQLHPYTPQWVCVN